MEIELNIIFIKIEAQRLALHVKTGMSMNLIQTSITLPLKYINLIEELVKKGKFPSKGEIIRVAIRRVIKRDNKRMLLLEKKSSG